jgi:hypothetical protein
LGEIAPRVPGVLMGLVLGHEIEGNLRMMVLVQPSATPLGHVLAAFSMAGLPELRRKRLTNALPAFKHRGSWFCTDDRGHVSEHFFHAASDHVNMEVDPLGWPRGCDPSRASEVAPTVRIGLGWQVRTPHHLR